MAFLTLKNLRFRQGTWQFAIDAKIERNSCTAIIGPSGAGKSTLLSLIAGFERPERGAIFVDAEDITALAPALRPVTILFQENNLFAHLTLARNIGLGRHPGLQLSAEDKTRIEEAVAAVGLDGLEDRLPESVSGGERQRAALARCLCQDRAVLLLDEPFNSLDPALRHDMRSLVDRLRRERCLTVLLVSHNPEEVAEIADTALFMHGGQILERGNLEELLKRPRTSQLTHYLGQSRE
jgi:thiamine transport system ATP-binding protein